MNCNNARMDGSLDLTSRKAETLVAEALEDTRVVTVNGARQAGEWTSPEPLGEGRRDA